MNEVYILAAKRTPMGSYGGCFQQLSATELGSLAIRAAVTQSGLPAAEVESVVMGNVLSAGLGQAPAKQASQKAGLPDVTCATTVNKVCASGMKAIGMLMQDIRTGNVVAGIAGGMESMSRVPHYIGNVRFGVGYGDKVLTDGLVKDGLTDAYRHESMGLLADEVAIQYGISRSIADDFAARSYELSMSAWEKGFFNEEVVSVSVPVKPKGLEAVTEDEGFRKVNFQKLRQLKPVFSSKGILTAANSSSMSDGGCALVLAGGELVKRINTTPLGRVVAYAEAEQDPSQYVSTPVLAARKVLARAGLELSDIDLFEVNEAFSIVPLVFARELCLTIDRINVRGGAVALGHPLGVSGARIVTSLLYTLRQGGKRYGLAAICNGGGGASAMIIENIEASYE